MNVKQSSLKPSQRLARSTYSFAVQVKVWHPFPDWLFFILNWLTHPAALIGTVEELAASQQTLNLVRDQFETNYFGPLNIVKATLPHLRRQKSGHIMILSGISKLHD